MNTRTHVVVALVFGTLMLHPAFAATIGTISVNSPADLTQVPQYTKVELNVALTTASTKFYETDPSSASGGVDLSAVFTGPDGSTWNIKGFYNGTSWLIRFAPTVLGAWTVTVSATDAGVPVNSTVGGPGFTCVVSSNPGFGQINGAYLRFSNQSAFYAIGHNNGWQYDVEQPALSDMASKGENLLSFWMATPWTKPSDGAPYNNRTPIENAAGGIGNYDQTACAYIDAVVGRAEAANVYLLPSIWAHDQLCDGSSPTGGWPASWSNNAYSTICSATNFYVTKNGSADTTQWRLQQNYYRYILARWGYSRAIVGWVAVVEIDGTTGYAVSPTTADNWCGALRTFFAGNDKYRTNAGGAYPLAISRVDMPSFNPGMDLTGTDSYNSQNSNTNISSTLASETSTMRSSGKPCFFPEFGGYVYPGDASEPTHMHNGVWAGTAAGDALSPLKWCDGGGWPLLDNTPVGAGLRSQLQYLSQFISGLDFPIDNSLTPVSLSLSPTSTQGWGMRLSDRGFAWIQNTSTNGTMGGQTLKVHGLLSGSYSVAWYNVWSSGSAPFATTPTITVTTGDLAVTLPTLAQSDLVCRFFKNAGGPVISGASASPNPVAGASTGVSASATDDNGNANITYTWSAINSPPAPVTFTLNGTNASQNSTATFTKAGSYTLQVSASDLGGLISTSTVNVTVYQTLTALMVTPASTIVNLNGTQQFTAAATDQFGNAMSPAFTWSVDQGGSISSTGFFQAGAVPNVTSTVTATAGTLTASGAVITVNAPPTVSIASPVNGAHFLTNANIVITANASDDNKVMKVDFYSNGTLLGTATAAPYTFPIANAANGSYSLTAVATDDMGSSTTSALVNVTVMADVPPAVSITSPTSGAVFAAGSNILITAVASDSDGTVTKVDFYNGTTLLGTVGSAPYTFTVSNAAGGSYALTAVATDNSGSTTTSSAVSVIVDAPPAVSISAPANNTGFAANSTITFTANATDSDGSVAKVQYFNGSTLIGTATAAPYNVAWASVASGAYTVTAQATDNLGLVKTSAPIIVVVTQLTVSITSPAQNARIRNPVTIKATASDSNSTIASVAFYDGNTLLGTVTNSPYNLTKTFSSGTHILKAKATDKAGVTTTSSTVTISVR